MLVVQEDLVDLSVWWAVASANGQCVGCSGLSLKVLFYSDFHELSLDLFANLCGLACKSVCYPGSPRGSKRSTIVKCFVIAPGPFKLRALAIAWLGETVSFGTLASVRDCPHVSDDEHICCESVSKGSKPEAWLDERNVP